MTVVGARPQFVKAAVLSQAMSRTGLAETLVHTGQHYDEALSGSFFRQLGLPEPAINLKVGSGSHGIQTARMLEGLERAMYDRSPDLVVVYGDTNSTLAAALAAAKLGLPIAHVEAGLRASDPSMPEEINRVVADRLSSLLFAPTPSAVANLIQEGLSPGSIHLVGDIMVDAALAFAPADTRPTLDRFQLEAKRFVLATVHRAENTDDAIRLEALISGLDRVAEKIPVLFCAHPRTVARMSEFRITHHHLRMHGAIDYLSSLALVRSAALVATDSGGLQKEAAVLGTPAVVLRDRTEWSELVAAGWCRTWDGMQSLPELVLSVIGCHGSPIIDSHGGGKSAGRMASIIAGWERPPRVAPFP